MKGIADFDDDIRHEDGYKDEYKVVVDKDGKWAPTNAELFKLIGLWFEAEDAAFGDGFGRLMPLFYIMLIGIGEEEKAQEAYGLRGMEAVRHFKRCVQEHADDIIEELERLKADV